MPPNPRWSREFIPIFAAHSAYLGFDRLLDAQTPLSESHDELLFIVLHQASEL